MPWPPPPGKSKRHWYEEEDLLMVLEALAQEDVQVLSELAQNHWDEG